MDTLLYISALLVECIQCNYATHIDFQILVSNLLSLALWENTYSYEAQFKANISWNAKLMDICMQGSFLYVFCKQWGCISPLVFNVFHQIMPYKFYQSFLSMFWGCMRVKKLQSAASLIKLGQRLFKLKYVKHLVLLISSILSV